MDPNEQIKKRLKLDHLSLSKSLFGESKVIFDRSGHFLVDRDKSVKSAISDVFDYMGLEIIPIPSEITDPNEQLDYLLRPAGVLQHGITLKDKWWKNAAGIMLGWKKDGTPVALIPKRFFGYYYIDKDTGKKITINSKEFSKFENEAVHFYKPLPPVVMTKKDFVKHILKQIHVSEVLLMSIAILCVSLFGLIIPYANRLIFEAVIPSEKIVYLIPILIMLISTALCVMLTNVIKLMVSSRMILKMNADVQSAVFGRLISLPVGFFKKLSAGNLEMRVHNIYTLSKLINTSLIAVISGIFSLVFFIQIWITTPQLVTPVIIIIVLTLGINSFVMLKQYKINNEINLIDARMNGLVNDVLSGIQKIKLAGAEVRAFTSWEKIYREHASLTYSPPHIIVIAPTITTIITMAGGIFIYAVGGISNISASDYMIFASAYGLLSGSLIILASVTTTIASMIPIFNLLEPVLNEVPELYESKHTVTHLDGNIRIEHLSFRYAPDLPLVLDDLSINIKKGDYVAIVGRTGCGKSTLMRILLGFESPETGAVYYDNMDLKDIDIHSLRRKIGTVLQEGKLFQSDIFSNISASAPWITHDDAWKAAKLAGLEKDIQAMPMGMMTFITPSGGGISGGQKQRILIARALASSPSVLFFDEATSSLDNISQKAVSDSLDSLNVTRVVIAHRLSTIKNCDRIILIENGNISEDGTFDELIAKKGLFAELVERQRLSTNSN